MPQSRTHDSLICKSFTPSSERGAIDWESSVGTPTHYELYVGAHHHPGAASFEVGELHECGACFDVDTSSVHVAEQCPYTGDSTVCHHGEYVVLAPVFRHTQQSKC